MFKTAFAESLFSAEVVRLIFPTIVAFVQQHDEGVNGAYFDCLISCLDFIPRDALRKDVCVFDSLHFGTLLFTAGL